MSRFPTLVLTLAALLLIACSGEREIFTPDDPRIYDLAELSVKHLRDREYGSVLDIEYEVQGRPSPSRVVPRLREYHRGAPPHGVLFPREAIQAAQVGRKTARAAASGGYLIAINIVSFNVIIGRAKQH